MSVRVQREDFDGAAALAALQMGRTDAGASCTFIGTVRDVPLTLEHYPGMTERCLEAIAAEARRRFGLLDACLIHRYGPLQPGEQIVLVIALSAHRQAAFDAANYMMDRLKTDAPFWKLEDGGWVAQREGDIAAAQAWQNP